MPTYSIPGPDGRTYSIEGPEGATREQVIAKIEAQLAAQRPPTVQDRFARNFDRAQQFMGRGPSHVAGMDASGAPIIAQGPAPAPSPEPSRSALDNLVGAGEVALTLATGGTGGLAGTIGGGLGGATGAVLEGEYGTPGAADRIQQQAQQSAAALTYQPRSEAGMAMLQSMDEALGWLPPIVGVANPGALAGAPRASARSRQLNREALADAQRSVGAAEQAVADVRQGMAGQLPVPLEGPAGLTTGQRTRDFGQLQFEKETAKLGDLGAPLRQRTDEQNLRMLQNFEALQDPSNLGDVQTLPGAVPNIPSTLDPREIGMAVDEALRSRKRQRKAEVTQAYQQARTAGEMEAPAAVDRLPDVLDELDPMAGVAPNINAARREAGRLGLVNDDGAAVPQSIDTLEQFRQFVNASTDFTVPREAMAARRLIETVDEAMADKGGPAFQRARRLAAETFQEFDGSDVARTLLASKNKSVDARRKAFEDVGQYAVVNSSVDELGKLRRSLLRAGDDGKQAWTNLKGYGIGHLMRQAFGDQMDARGNPIMTPSKLKRAVERMDQQGKLDAIYGRKAAQTIRDLTELSTVINTAPPGAINHSNTSAAIQAAIVETAGAAAFTGLPIPALTAIKQAANLYRDQRLKKRINDALAGR